PLGCYGLRTTDYGLLQLPGHQVEVLLRANQRGDDVFIANALTARGRIANDERLLEPWGRRFELGDIGVQAHRIRGPVQEALIETLHELGVILRARQEHRGNLSASRAIGQESRVRSLPGGIDGPV